MVVVGTQRPPKNENMSRSYLIIILSLSLIFFSLSGCSRTKTERTTIYSFSIADYEFDIDHVRKIDKWSGKVIKEYDDTVLTNVCDYCSDCENENDQPDPVRR